jgi:hypothetical protein
MNKRRGLAIGVCTPLLLLALSSSSSAALQTTSKKCAKAGAFRTSKNIRYQCKKSAKGLQWVVASPKVKPKTATSSTPAKSTTTTSVAIPSDAVARKVYDLVIDALSVGPSSTAIIECLLEGSDYEKLVSEACPGGSRAAEFYSKLGFPLPAKNYVVFSQTDVGLRRIATEKGCDQPPIYLQSLAGGGYAIGGRCRSGETLVIAGRLQDWAAAHGPTIGFHHTVPHELFHQWQMTNTSNCITWQCGNSDFPKWLWEGTPQFMTRFVYWSWNRSKDPSQWLDYWYQVERTDMFTRCNGVTIEQMVDPHAPWFNSNWCAYSKGQIAIEVLVANYGGFETLRKLHTTKTTPGHGDFGVLFRNVTGREISDFYSEVNSYFVTRNWP